MYHTGDKFNKEISKCTKADTGNKFNKEISKCTKADIDKDGSSSNKQKWRTIGSQSKDGQHNYHHKVMDCCFCHNLIMKLLPISSVTLFSIHSLNFVILDVYPLIYRQPQSHTSKFSNNRILVVTIQIQHNECHTYYDHMKFGK